MDFATGQKVKFKNSYGEFTGEIVSQIGDLFEIQVDPDGRIYEATIIVTAHETDITAAE